MARQKNKLLVMSNMVVSFCMIEEITVKC